MNNFPHDFADHTIPLSEKTFHANDVTFIKQLAEKGYEIQVGLTEKYAADIRQMCLQPSIKEFCPNDFGRRFKDDQATANWLAKGRAAFLLIKKEDNSLAGYGWAGAETSLHAPGGQTTFAIRIGEADQGKGLSTPYARLIVVGAAKMYNSQDFWLETWASDGAAVHIYHKIGFIDVDQIEDNRLTAAGENIPDTRLYMSLPNDLLQV